MTYGRFALVTAALTLVVTGCGGRADQEYYNALPTSDGLTLEVSGAASEGVTQALKFDGVGTSQTALTGSGGELLSYTRNGVRAVNGAVHSALDHIQSIVQNNEGHPGPTAGTRVYGPADRGNLTLRLTVKKFTRLAFGFRLEAKPIGAEDSAYLVVFGGAIQRSAEPHQGKGIVGFNLDNLKLVDPSFPGQGKLLAGFAHREEGKALAFRAVEFTPDTTEHDPVSAAFVGWKRASDNGTAVRLALKADITGVENNTPLKELIGLRARWIPGVGGRGAAIARNGDIPDGTFYVLRGCWNANEDEVFKILRKCTVDSSSGTPVTTCTIVGTPTGDVSACTLTDEVADPDGSFADTTQEAGSPITDGADAPADVPTGDSAL